MPCVRHSGLLFDAHQALYGVPRVESDCIGKIQKFDHIDPPLAAFHRGNVGLVPTQQATSIRESASDIPLIILFAIDGSPKPTGTISGF
jgi:hypothetical protein